MPCEFCYEPMSWETYEFWGAPIGQWECVNPECGDDCEDE